MKLQKLTGKKNYVLNTTVMAGSDAVLVFSVDDGWGEYRLTMTRPAATDQITITYLGLFSLTADELTGIREMSYDQMVNGKWSNGKCFYLSGRRLTVPPAKGVYIENGKKVTR